MYMLFYSYNQLVIYIYRSQVKSELLMRTEERHNLFEDIGTQVSIIWSTNTTFHWL